MTITDKEVIEVISKGFMIRNQGEVPFLRWLAELEEAKSRAANARDSERLTLRYLAIESTLTTARAAWAKWKPENES